MSIEDEIAFHSGWSLSDDASQLLSCLPPPTILVSETERVSANINGVSISVLPQQALGEAITSSACGIHTNRTIRICANKNDAVGSRELLVTAVIHLLRSHYDSIALLVGGEECVLLKKDGSVAVTNSNNYWSDVLSRHLAHSGIEYRLSSLPFL